MTTTPTPTTPEWHRVAEINGVGTIYDICANVALIDDTDDPDRLYAVRVASGPIARVVRTRLSFADAMNFVRDEIVAEIADNA